MSAARPDPQCLNCWEEFDIDASPDVDRCERCAEEQAWQNGTAQLITVQPRSGEGAVLVAPLGLVVNAPVGRKQREG